MQSGVTFWHIALLLLSALAAPISRLTIDDRDCGVLALRPQVLILQRQLGNRPQLTRTERLPVLLRCWRKKNQQLLDSLLLVKPDTLVAWYRA